jgi:alpha-beta hydrolase superfamily lysophospholipase
MRNRLHSPVALKGAAAALAVGLAFAPPMSATAAPPPAHSLDSAAAAVMRLPAPQALRYRARDGAALAYRAFEPASQTGPSAVVAILLHGSAGSSLNMTVLGEALARAGVPAFALDARGQGLSGRRGDIDYIGQQDDDLADFVAVTRKIYPNARLVLVGHSAGGGFALRVAGEAEGGLFSRFVLLSPVLGRLAPTTRPDAGWARPDVPRILLLGALNQVGVTAFNGAQALDFNLPPGAEALGLTRAWSYRMMINYGPRGQTQLFGHPAYWRDAAHAPAPIVVIAGTADEQFYADRYAIAFKGLAQPVRVELAPGVDHMGVVSDPRAVPLIVAAVRG